MATVIGVTQDYIDAALASKLDVDGLLEGSGVTIDVNPTTKQVTVSATGVGGEIGNFDAASSIITTPSGYPTFSSWTIYGNDVGATEDGGHIISVPAGTYIAQVKLDIDVTPIADDLYLGLNLFSSSAYVVQEFPIKSVKADGSVLASYSVGPWPIGSGQGSLSVSFYFPETSGSPTISGSCVLLLTKIV